jgi:hypothetical protein
MKIEQVAEGLYGAARAPQGEAWKPLKIARCLGIELALVAWVALVWAHSFLQWYGCCKPKQITNMLV